MSTMRNDHRVWVALATAFLLLAVVRPAAATPIYAVRAARACNTCHIEPIGWNDPPEKKDRKCSVDCGVCHVNRTGGGLRTPAGDYYGLELLPTFSFDDRPSAGTNPESHRPPDDQYSTIGRYRLWEGFSGWKSGNTNVHEITDRYGSIDADPMVTVGMDARLMVYAPLGDTDTAVFPMQLDGHIYGEVMDDLAFYGTVGLQGRQARTVNSANTENRFQELFTLRELAVDYGAIPYNGYVRGGRFTKPYGWRYPDHTVSTRKPLDFDQFSQVWGAEVGINPNYAFAHVAGYYQGIPDFPGEQAPKGAGASFIAGYRDLGWQAGLSFEGLRVFDIQEQDRITIGPMWGLNLFPVTYTGELDIRASLANEDIPEGETGLYLYNEINALMYQGVNALVSHSWYRGDMGDKASQRSRITFGAQWDVVQHVQLALNFRLRFNAGDLAEQDFLLWMHLWL